MAGPPWMCVTGGGGRAGEPGGAVGGRPEEGDRGQRPRCEGAGRCEGGGGEGEGAGISCVLLARRQAHEMGRAYSSLP